jgi:hypothetical protein
MMSDSRFDDFHFQIGDIVCHKQNSKMEFCVIGRTLQEFSGGIQKLYEVRGFVASGLLGTNMSTQSFYLHECEVVPSKEML